MSAARQGDNKIFVVLIEHSADVKMNDIVSFI